MGNLEDGTVTDGTNEESSWENNYKNFFDFYEILFTIFNIETEKWKNNLYKVILK